MQDAQTAWQWKKADVKGKLTTDVPKSQLLTNTKASNDSHAQARVQFGIGRDFKALHQQEQYRPETHVQDPRYYAEAGITESGWEDEL